MRLLFILVFGACIATSQQPIGSVDAADVGSGDVPDVRCDGAPDARAGGFRHTAGAIVASLGNPRHRGFDLIAAASAGTQTVEGWLSYTIADKALEDEDVDLYACVAGGWQKLGTATTDDEGHFALVDHAPLPLGLRDLYASVVGDRTGTKFLAYVAPDDSPLIVSDVDGTLTSSENAFIASLAFGGEPAQQAGASAAFEAAVARSYQPVYVTARGNQYTDDTRQWLADLGFPRGPLRLAPSFVTLPGGDTVDFKTAAIGDLIAANLNMVWGIGNRASDITAYANVGLAGDHILIKLPEYQSEVEGALADGQAVGFTTYGDLALTK